MAISKDLRRVIEASGRTRYELAKLSGVTEGTLSKFMAGADVTTRTLDALAPVLGLRLVVENGAKPATTIKRSTTRKAGR